MNAASRELVTNPGLGSLLVGPQDNKHSCSIMHVPLVYTAPGLSSSCTSGERLRQNDRIAAAEHRTHLQGAQVSQLQHDPGLRAPRGVVAAAAARPPVRRALWAAGPEAAAEPADACLLRLTKKRKMLDVDTKLLCQSLSLFPATLPASEQTLGWPADPVFISGCCVRQAKRCHCSQYIIHSPLACAACQPPAAAPHWDGSRTTTPASRVPT